MKKKGIISTVISLILIAMMSVACFASITYFQENKKHIYAGEWSYMCYADKSAAGNTGLLYISGIYNSVGNSAYSYIQARVTKSSEVRNAYKSETTSLVIPSSLQTKGASVSLYGMGQNSVECYVTGYWNAN